MGDAISSFLFQPPPPSKLKESKIIWLNTSRGTRIPAFYIEAARNPASGAFDAHSRSHKDLHSIRKRNVPGSGGGGHEENGGGRGPSGQSGRADPSLLSRQRRGSGEHLSVVQIPQQEPRGECFGVRLHRLRPCYGSGYVLLLLSLVTI